MGKVKNKNVVPANPKGGNKPKEHNSDQASSRGVRKGANANKAKNQINRKQNSATTVVSDATATIKKVKIDCKYCTRSFVDDDALEKHVQSHKKKMCPVCDAFIPIKHALDAHINTHNSDYIIDLDITSSANVNRKVKGFMTSKDSCFTGFIDLDQHSGAVVFLLPHKDIQLYDTLFAYDDQIATVVNTKDPFIETLMWYELGLQIIKWSSNAYIQEKLGFNTDGPLHIGVDSLLDSFNGQWYSQLFNNYNVHIDDEIDECDISVSFGLDDSLDTLISINVGSVGYSASGLFSANTDGSGGVHVKSMNGGVNNRRSYLCPDSVCAVSNDYCVTTMVPLGSKMALSNRPHVVINNSPDISDKTYTVPKDRTELTQLENTLSLMLSTSRRPWLPTKEVCNPIFMDLAVELKQILFYSAVGTHTLNKANTVMEIFVSKHFKHCDATTLANCHDIARNTLDFVLSDLANKDRFKVNAYWANKFDRQNYLISNLYDKNSGHYDNSTFVGVLLSNMSLLAKAIVSTLLMLIGLVWFSGDGGELKMELRIDWHPVFTWLLSKICAIFLYLTRKSSKLQKHAIPKLKCLWKKFFYRKLGLVAAAFVEEFIFRNLFFSWYVKALGSILQLFLELNQAGVSLFSRSPIRQMAKVQSSVLFAKLRGFTLLFLVSVIAHNGGKHPIIGFITQIIVHCLWNLIVRIKRKGFNYLGVFNYKNFLFKHAASMVLEASRNRPVALTHRDLFLDLGILASRIWDQWVFFLSFCLALIYQAYKQRHERHSTLSINIDYFTTPLWERLVSSPLEEREDPELFSAIHSRPTIYKIASIIKVQKSDRDTLVNYVIDSDMFTLDIKNPVDEATIQKDTIDPYRASDHLYVFDPYFICYKPGSSYKVMRFLFSRMGRTRMDYSLQKQSITKARAIIYSHTGDHYGLCTNLLHSILSDSYYGHKFKGVDFEVILPLYMDHVKNDYPRHKVKALVSCFEKEYAFLQLGQVYRSKRQKKRDIQSSHNFPKANEKLIKRPPEFKPRAISGYPMTLVAALGAHMYYIVALLKLVLNPAFGIEQFIVICGIEFSLFMCYGSGATAYMLSIWRSRVLSRRNCIAIIACGDDSGVIIKLNTIIIEIEGDFSSYDASQSAAIDNCHQFWLDVGIDPIIIDILSYMARRPSAGFYKTSQVDETVFKFDTKGVPLRHSGSVETTPGNTVFTLFSTLSVVLDYFVYVNSKYDHVSESFSDGFFKKNLPSYFKFRFEGQYGMGFTTVDLGRESTMSFLKGWWMPLSQTICINNKTAFDELAKYSKAIRPNMVSYFSFEEVVISHMYLPLPSRILKLGSSLTDPVDIYAGKPGYVKTKSDCVASFMCDVITSTCSYPILDPVMKALQDRYSLPKVKLSMKAKFKDTDIFKYAKVDPGFPLYVSTYIETHNIHIRSQDFSNYMHSRYSINEDELAGLLELIGAPVFGYRCHSSLSKLAQVDYL